MTTAQGAAEKPSTKSLFFQPQIDPAVFLPLLRTRQILQTTKGT